MSFEGEKVPPTARVPELGRRVMTGGGQLSSVGAETHALHESGMSLKRQSAFACASMPNLDRRAGT